MAAKRSNTCRLRKLACQDCGYTVRVARSWMTVGLPDCPCGHGRLEPEDAADRAFCGLLGQDDVTAAAWTAICRANGWEDSIVRKGAAYKAWQAKDASHVGSRRAGAAHCVYAGCGRWVADGADVCSAGHSQTGDVFADTAAAMPF